MKRTEFNWLIKDSFNSLDRLDRIYQEMDWLLHLHDVEEDYMFCLNQIDENLNQLKKDHGYHTRGKYLCEISKYCYRLMDIYDKVTETLTDENYHRHNRIFGNEPLIIASNMNEINNAGAIY